MRAKLLLFLIGLLLITSCAKSIDGGEPTPTSDGTLVIPVVFHVLYEDPNDKTQNPPYGQFVGMMQILNNFFSAKNTTVDGLPASTPINIKFELATHNPSGQKMTEAGVNRVYYQNSKEMSGDAFLAAKHPTGSANDKIFWDLNNYINVWVFGFSEENISGISYLAYSSSKEPLEGTNNGDKFFSELPNYMHGIVLNNKIFSNKDGISTLSHEMAHYLGLYHAFFVSTDEVKDDYCSDTPTYDRDKYDADLEAYFEATQNPIWETVINRVSSDGKEFISTNIMDYYYGYSYAFTPQQRDRIEHVLKYSPLIPRKDNAQRERMSKVAIDTEELPTPIIMR